MFREMKEMWSLSHTPMLKILKELCVRILDSQGLLGHGGHLMSYSLEPKENAVFASIKPSDVRVDDRTALGKRAFRDFLEFSETGMIRGIMNVRGDADNEFEESIGRAIGNLGYKVDFQVGFEGFFIDMAIKNPNDEGEYLLGIEADGATYHSSPSARSRDRYRQEILEMRGWNIHRVWSTNWFTNPDEEIRKIVDRIEAELSILGESDIA